MGQFQIEQTYDLQSLTVLCRAARKTVRRWARVLRGFCWVLLAAGAAVVAMLLAVNEAPNIWMLAVFATLLILLLSEDRLNGWIALKQLVPGTAHSVTVFDGDGYTVATDTTETKYRFENVTSLCETERYFIFFLGNRHGQIFRKQGFQLGDPDAFRVYVAQKTGKAFQTIK